MKSAAAWEEFWTGSERRKPVAMKRENLRMNIVWIAAGFVFCVLPAARCVSSFAGNPSPFRKALPAPTHELGRVGRTGNHGVPFTNTAAKAMGDHYLMLVNTALAEKMKPEMLAQFDHSPYDGLAVAFSWNYDAKPAPSSADIDAQIAAWKRITNKDIWPWVYLNRIVAVDDAQKNPHTTGPYFHQIQGADLENKTGAQKEFLEVWANSLAAARDSGMPGIACDMEFYNNYKEYNPTELSRQLGKTPEETQQLLRALGARMADSAAAQFPDATLWFLFTALATPVHATSDPRPYYMSPAYVAMGLLEEIQKKHFRLKVLSGGEAGLGYCHPTLRQFQQQIQERAAGFASYLQKYNGILELGGTMTLWRDQEGRTGICPDSDAPTVENLEPYLQLLLRTYRYNWIYGSTDQGYDAFGPQVAPRFDAVIRKARAGTALPAGR
jgi:hypothetical protein